MVDEDEDAKNAVVLSPMLWDFGATDEGSDVADILAAADGYEGRVTYLANATETDTTIGFEQYKNLDAYNVIHIATHGAAVCDEEGECWGSFVAFTLDSIEPTLVGETLEERLASIAEEGLALGQSGEGDDLTIMLTARFFEAHYPSGIGDAVIMISACETMAAEGSDLVAAMKGQNAVYVGWDAAVDGVHAGQAARALYGRLADEGHSVGEAHAAIGGLKTDPRGAAMRVSGRDGGGDVRIRQVVQLLDPTSLEELADGADVDVDGVAGDDIDDVVPYAVRVDGIEAEDASDVRVRIIVDGVETTRAVASGTRDDGWWLLEGGIDLGYGLDENKQVDIEAVVELPEGGESDDSSTIDLLAEVSGTWSLRVDFTHTSFREREVSEKSSGSADLVLVADEFQPSDDVVRYSVAGGSATLDLNYESPLCIQSGPALQWEVNEENAAGSQLKIDWSSDPPSLTATISIRGPTFDGEIACRAGTGPDAPPGYGDPEPTSFGTSPAFLIIEAEDAQRFDPSGTRSSGQVTREVTGDFGSVLEMTFSLTETVE